MASAAARARLEQAAKTGKPVDGTTFKSKSDRKAYRKTLRSRIANKLADQSMNRHEKSEFYRTLRLVKMRRRMIASELRQLAEMCGGLQREIDRVHNRVPGSDPSIVAWASGRARDAASRASLLADDYAAFSRKTVLRYRTDGKVAA